MAIIVKLLKAALVVAHMSSWSVAKDLRVGVGKGWHLQRMSKGKQLSRAIEVGVDYYVVGS